MNPIHLIFLLSTGCSSPIEAPKCESQEDGACFKGVFRTLLSQPVEGIEVCTVGQEIDSCVTTDDLGQWKIPGLPINSNVVITAEHPDFVSTVFAQNTSMDWYDWYKVAIPKSIMNTNANRLDIELNPERGHILFLTWEGLNIDGIDTPNVSDVVLSNANDFPYAFYGDGLGLASDGLESTSGSGSGGVLNLVPDTYNLILEAPAGLCGEETIFHFPQTDTGIPVPVKAGFTTAIDVQCPIID